MHPVLLVAVVGGLLYLIMRKDRPDSSRRCMCSGRSAGVMVGPGRCACVQGSRGHQQDLMRRFDCKCTCKMCVVKMSFVNAMSDHIAKTRIVVTNAFLGSGELNASVQDLLSNQDLIASLLAGSKTLQRGARTTADDIYQTQSQLWREHITIAIDVVKAVIGNSPDLARLQLEWQANADRIAQSLAAMNTQAWPLSVLSDHMRTHLQLLTEFVVAFAGKRWDQTVALANQSTAHFRMFGIILSKGAS
jgi:hypothetical protein